MGNNNTDNKLENSTIKGDYIGRDDNSVTFIQNKNFRSTYLNNLYERFEKEKKENPEFQEICDELDYFNSILEGDVIGLDEKLKQGGREKILFYALDVKDKFHKKLMQTSQYSLIAQDINVYILSKVRSSFMREIYFLICNNAPDEKINLMITERIIKPVQEDLGLNLFKYNEDDIMGMIFFLTGNCHLKWN